METLFNAIIALIASEMQVHPEAINAVRHYFFGGGKERTLPEEYHQETKEYLLNYLEEYWRNPRWHGINCTRPSTEAPMGEGWMFSLWGVIGSFNFEIEEKENSLVFNCWDLFDFNEDIGDSVAIPSTNFDNAIIMMAKVWGVEVEKEENVNGKVRLRAKEEELASLNKGREYYTRWDIDISSEELANVYRKVAVSKFDIHNFDWKHGGLPKSWIKSLSLAAE